MATTTAKATSTPVRASAPCPAPSGQVRATMLCIFGITLAILVIAGSHAPKGMAGAAVGVLAGACFLLCGSVLRFFDAAVGNMVIARVTRTRENWQTDTLRSFIETGCFINVLFQAYNFTENILFAVVVGTLAGIFMVLCGEAFKNLLQSAEVELRRTTGTKGVFSNDAFAFVYVGAVTVVIFIGHHIRVAKDVGTAICLATATGVAFTTATQLFVAWRPTRNFGKALQRRILNTQQNWADKPVRSGMECGFFLGFIYGSYALSQSLVCAMLVGTLAGILVCTVGDLMLYASPICNALHARVHARVQRSRGGGKGGSKGGSMTATTAATAATRSMSNNNNNNNNNKKEGGEDDGAVQGDTSLTPLCLFGWFGFALMYTIYEYEKNFLHATLLGISTGIALTVMAQVFTLWGPTAKFGVLLQDRVLGNPTDNWRSHPWRSFLEISVFSSVLFVTYVFYGSFLYAVQTGTFTGIMTVLFNDFGSLWGDEEEEAQALLKAQQQRNGSGSGNGGSGGSPTPHFVVRPEDDPLRPGAPSGPAAARYNLVGPRECHRDVIERTVAERVQVAGQPGTAHSRWAERANKKISWTDLRRHNEPHNAWLAIHGRVYDVARWAKRHPGGNEVILKFAGADATDQFDAFHQPGTAQRLLHYQVGVLEEAAAAAAAVVGKEAGQEQQLKKKKNKNNENNKKTTEAAAAEAAAAQQDQDKTPAVRAVTKDYRVLREKLWREGWFEADGGYFLMKDVVMVAFIAASIAVLSAGQGSVPSVIACGILLGLGIKQAAFVAHDALHNGVVKPARNGGFNLVGWIHGSLIFGISADMWLVEHSLHHAITRRPCEDPQFNYLPLWLISPKELTGPFAFPIDWVTRKLIRVQHFTMIPLAMIFGRFNLHAISVVYAVKNRKFMDLVGILLYFAWFGAIVACVPHGGAPGAVEGVASWPWLRIAFVLVTYTTIGILHVQLLVNHMDVEAYTESEERAEQFFRFQCLTTRNTDTEWYDGWFHGGLQYQIEHHLFPQLPRHRLHEVRPLVMDLCAKHNVPYRSSAFSASVVNCLKDLKGLSTHLMNMDAGDLG